MRPAIGYLDPETTREHVIGLHRRLVGMGLVREGSLNDCDVVFCDGSRHGYFRGLREEQGRTFHMNLIPEASIRLHHKKYFARDLRGRPYTLRTYLKFCLRPLRGLWVEKPYNVDRGEGITFLRDPRLWRRKDHLLQEYLADPWLFDDRKCDLRMLALIRDDGSVRVHREALVRVAHRPFTLEDLDPLIHNANSMFQRRMGVKEIEQYLLSELVADGTLVDSMAEIVRDTVATLERKGRFGGSGDFELMGYDFLVDRTGRPFLLEANCYPGLWFDTDVGRRFYLVMIEALYRDL